MDAPLVDLVVAEWPAVLSVVVLVGGHLVFLLVLNDGLRPLGAPFFIAIAVFILAEIGRELWSRANR